ncbi:hypothetical protein BDZ85DRAFT_282453 [Elsinoe ampelina]|uniref:alpha-glucosidase n=1 Tax=Elsinoe ampelina TaxID=302913 RepID=A0A6A6GA05_9PEZI|nr:hypothetical protein BDZ85DRAFT_282453 [Elsinoe ampelina]
MPQQEQVTDSFVREDDLKSGSTWAPGLGDGDKKNFETGGITTSVDWTGAPIVTLGWVGSEELLHSDLPYQSYLVDGSGIAHYTRHDREALHVGLGEVAAPMDLTARSFKIDATDCFGYEPNKTSTRYEHMPSWSKRFHKAGFYKVYRQDYGGLDEYLIVGKTMKDFVRTYAELVGFPLLAPKWAFAYLSGGYKYTMQDDPSAHQYLLDFADKLKVAPKVRNVFNWNKHRFPDPEAFLAKYHALGFCLLSNIKPFILASHPDFDKLKTKDMAYVRLWRKNGVRRLREQGVDAMWNDNNEYTLPNDSWQISLKPEILSTPKTVGLWGLVMQTWYEDDGLHIKPDITRFEVAYNSTEEKVVVEVTLPSGDKFVPEWKEIAIIFPVGDKRHVVSASGTFLETIGDDESGRRRYVPPQVTRLEFAVNGYH